MRIEALGICTVLLLGDREDAVRRFVAACQCADERVLLPQPYLNEFLSYSIRTYHPSFSELIQRMVASPIDDIAQNGAAWALVVWLDHGLLEDVVRACAAGSVPHRRGQADVLAGDGKKDNPDPRTLDMLMVLFADPDATVRREAGSVFWSRDGVFGLPHMPALADRFVRSPAFQDRAAQFVRELEEHGGPILAYADVVLEMCRAYAGPLAESSRDIRTDVGGATRDLVMLLLRVYDQSRDAGRADIESACLDVVDAMLSNRVGLMASAVDDLDVA